MKYNFDEIIDRKNTNSLKYDFAVERGKPEGVLPLWVADMDFRVPPCVQDKIKEHVERGIFGYSDAKSEYFHAIENWYKQYYGYQLREEWLVKTPGVVFAIAASIRAFSERGDGVLIQPPVYYPFREEILYNSRKLVTNELHLSGERYEIDLGDFENKIRKNKVKLFILCNPHNPVGRVFREDELRRMGEICARHGVIVVADEIHSDLIFPGHKHIVFAGLSEEFEQMTISCTSPSKTFNLAGLQVANIFIANKGLRAKFNKAVAQTGYGQLNLFGLVASQAAYESGREWLEQLGEYLNGNLKFARDFLLNRLDGVRLIEPEGTYLIWLDCRGLSLNEEEREELIVKKAGLWLDSGRMFGECGEGFERINIACPRKTLETAFYRLLEALG
ncbi:MAG: pyridoxal phosphate-dependent aminotransferase [Lachnospiraceae bacterium]|jgi:cystathionine beta-lyase|nr:pyridoxal phosphate-dependent aminotransferase [Lachnospiraceae bacterium]